jgi:hypothetical protein
MDVEKMRLAIETSQDSHAIKELFNSCSLTISRIDTEKGLQENLHSIKAYNQAKEWYENKYKMRGWKTAEEVLGKDYAARAAAQGLTVSAPPAKKLKLKCGCLIASDTKSTVKSCGDSKHPVGRIVNIK